jgi:hypothetical protein
VVSRVELYFYFFVSLVSVKEFLLKKETLQIFYSVNKDILHHFSLSGITKKKEYFHCLLDIFPVSLLYFLFFFFFAAFLILLHIFILLSLAIFKKKMGNFFRDYNMFIPDDINTKHTIYELTREECFFLYFSKISQPRIFFCEYFSFAITIVKVIFII